MSQIVDLIYKLSLYKTFKKFGFPKLMPIVLNLNITEGCNSRCKTCNIWKIKPKNELTLIEYKKIFESLGSLFWVTVAGGEPFLRKDMKDIVVSLYKKTNPRFLTIPTNAILTEKIIRDTKYIIKRCPDLELVINLSLDGVGNLHDKIRGVKGNFQKVLETYYALKEINSKKLTIGINTVISKHNINHMKELYDFVTKNLKPDSYVCEVAENRARLHNLGLDLTPHYKEILKFFVRKLKKGKNGVPELIKNLRINFYKHLIDEEALDCYAGYASANIQSKGDVWICDHKKNRIGNLRRTNYDFKKIWFSEKADEERSKVKKCKHKCKLVNAFYTSTMCNFSILTGFVKRTYKRSYWFNLKK